MCIDVMHMPSAVINYQQCCQHGDVARCGELLDPFSDFNSKKGTFGAGVSDSLELHTALAHFI